MAKPENIPDAISENARGPKKATVDGVNVEQHGLADQIMADKYTKAGTAQRKRRLGLTVRRQLPPGAV